MKKTFSIIALLILFSGLVPPRLAAAQEAGLQTVDIQPDESSMIDTQLMSAAATTNYATSADLTVGEVNNATNTGRSYLMFDLSTMPTAIDLVSATLTLTVKTDLADNGGRINVHAVKQNSPVESQATWTRYKTGSNWTTLGAGSAVDDIEGAPIGDVVTTNNITAGTQITITLDPDAVKEMIFENYFGFILRMETESDDAYVFYSSSAASATDRPKLHLEYYNGFADPDPGWFCADYSSTLTVIDDATCNNPMAGQVVSPYISDGIITDHITGANVRKFLRLVRLNCDPYPLCKNDLPIYYKIGFTLEWTSSAPSGTAVIESGKVGINTVNNQVGEVLYDGLTCGSGASGKCSYVFEGVIPVENIDTVDNSDEHDFDVYVSFVVNGVSPVYIQSATVFKVEFSTEPLTGDCAATYLVPTIDTYEIDPTLETPLGVVGAETPADEQIYPTVPDSLYILRTQGGPWNDGAVNDRYDTEVSTDGVYWTDLYDWASLNGLCVETDPVHDDLVTVYFTATEEQIHIRVNDSPGQFGNNTATHLTYSIGIAFEVLAPPSCAAQYTYGTPDIVSTVDVVSTSDDVNVEGQFTPGEAYQFEAGEWYAIEVTNGTWGETAMTNNRIDMEFEWLRIGDWLDLIDAAPAVGCVSDDGLTVYIQAPRTDELSLRVNDQDTPQNWSDNTGTLEVTIYHATYTPFIQGCAMGFQIGDLLNEDTVDGNAANGKSFATYPNEIDVATWGDTTYYLDLGDKTLVPGAWYVLETTQGPWSTTLSLGDIVAMQPYYDMQIKVGDADWVDLMDWTGAECVVQIDEIGHVRAYFQVPNDEALLGQDYLLKVASNSHPVTRGFMGWKLYKGSQVNLQTAECSDFVYDPDVYTPGRVDGNSEDGQYIPGLGAQIQSEYFAIHLDTEETAWQEDTGAADESDLLITSDGINFDLLPETPNVLCYYYTPVTNELVFIIGVTPGQQWEMKADSISFADNTGYIDYKVHPVSVGDLDPWTSCIDDYQPTVPAINEFEWIPPQDEEGIHLMPTLTYTEEQDPDGDGIIYWGEPSIEGGHYYMVETKEGPWRSPETASYDAQISKDNGETWGDLDAENLDLVCADEDQLGQYWRAIFYVEEGERWKIRVADVDGEFTDNTGNLAYRLSLVNEFPIDGPGALVTNYNPDAFDLCVQSLVRPQALTLSEIGSLGNYLGDWFKYVNRSAMGYIAWCPRHTDMLLSALKALQTKEPLASIAEFATIQRNVMKEVNAYDWEGGYQDTSIFTTNGAGDVDQIIEENILPTNGEGFSPWEGGDLVSFDDTALPAYYTSCSSVFLDYLPTGLATSVCFVSAYWKETGASFWVQLSLDIGALFLFIGSIKNGIQSLVYMMTGVRIWTKDRALQVVVNAAEGAKRK